MVPKAQMPSFLLGRNYQPNQLRVFLQRLQVCFEAKDSNQDVRELIIQTCQAQLKSAYPKPNTRDLYMGPVVVAAVFMADQNLFRDALHLVTNSLDETTFSDLGKLVSFQALTVAEEE